MRRRSVSMVLVSCLAGASLLTAPLATPPALAENVLNTSMPVAMAVFVPCANGGAGELVELTGDMHLLINFTTDKNGGIHAKIHIQPQGVSGVGLVSGDRYQATGVTQRESDTQAGFESTFVNNFNIIGQGSGNNSTMHELVHMTINANGEATAFADNFRAECK